MSRKGALRLASRISRYSSSPTSCVRERREIPALLMRRSSPEESAACPSLSERSSSVTSPSTIVQLVLFSSFSESSRRSSKCLLQFRMSYQPSSEKRSAAALPIPRDAPVMIASFKSIPLPSPKSEELRSSRLFENTKTKAIILSNYCPKPTNCKSKPIMCHQYKRLKSSIKEQYIPFK